MSITAFLTASIFALFIAPRSDSSRPAPSYTFSACAFSAGPGAADGPPAHEASTRETSAKAAIGASNSTSDLRMTTS
jgi:hypothetical protein